jgi:hypothetical protein
MTDAQLLDYFRNFNGNGCGRFTAEQLDRLIKPVEVPKSKWWARIAAGLLIAMGITKEADAQRKGESIPVIQIIPVVNQSPDSLVDESLAINGYEIHGTVVDQHGEPVFYPEVVLYEQGIVLKKTLTDIDGNYSFVVSKPGKYDIEVTYHGNKKTIVGINAQKRRTKVPVALPEDHIQITVGLYIKANGRPAREEPGQKTHRAGDNLPPGY